MKRRPTLNATRILSAVLAILAVTLPAAASAAGKSAKAPT